MIEDCNGKDMNDYVNFGDVARQKTGLQCQYACRYFDDAWERFEYKFLGGGLRILGNSRNYHEMQIHKDDVPEAVKRYREHVTECRRKMPYSS